MKETFIIKLSHDEVYQLLVDHYKEQYPDGNFEIVFDRREVDDYPFPGTTFITCVKLIRGIKIGNHVATHEQNLERDDIEKVIAQELKHTGYEIEYISCDDLGFYGAEIRLKRKQKQYSMRR